MSGLFRCVCYFAVTGTAGFFLGRLLPKAWFPYDAFPYQAFAFERDGKLYERLGIRLWKEKLPDMSRILPRWIPSKRLPRAMTAEQVEVMLRETCVAEFIHILLCITGLGCLGLWEGAGLLYGIYVLGNIPFCLIQRYNRPKLARIYERLLTREAGIQGEKRKTNEKSFDTELQYGTGA